MPHGTSEKTTAERCGAASARSLAGGAAPRDLNQVCLQPRPACAVRGQGLSPPARLHVPLRHDFCLAHRLPVLSLPEYFSST